MAVLSSLEIYILFGSFAAVMVAAVWIFTSKDHMTPEKFLLADRKVTPWRGAFSMAVSWVWAPAIFICSMQAYTKGLAGVFWFTAPNILCFFVFAVLVKKLREKMPDGYSLPDFIWHRFQKNKPAHLAFLLIAFGYQISAIIINAVAGGTLLNLVSGIDINLAITGMVALALLYSLISGLKASILTDLIQMLMIVTFAVILVPWTIINSGGWASVTNGLGGISGEHASILHPGIAWAFGIPMTLSLIAGPISDQMFYQRAFAVSKEKIITVFVRAGIMFGLVPVTLSVFGFIAVSQNIPITDPQMVAPIVISTVLPEAALYLFIIMAFAGLCSTMDSAFCGISALGSIDIIRKYKPAFMNGNILKTARLFMISSAVIGGGIALLKPQLLWVFFIYGALASSGLIPTILAIFWDRITAKDLCVSILTSLIIATPLSVCANFSGNENLVVLSAIFSVGLSGVVCFISGLLNTPNAHSSHCRVS